MLLLKYTILFLAGYIAYPVEAVKDQERPPVTWTLSAEQISRTEIMLKLHASLGRGWHLYSQHMEEGGPIPTRITLAASDDYVPAGGAIEKGDAVKFRDEFYDMDIIWYLNEVSFLQRVKVFQPVNVISGSIAYMICDDHLCIPHQQDFNIAISGSW
jgi:thiol:disulfide interchange protein DsbD